MWLQRLDAMPFWPALWMKHQRRDDYWRHGSVCEDFSAIQCPVFAVGGWADAYTNAIPRLLEGLKVPRLGLIGPWAHLYPQDGKPGPAIGFLQEALRWWDHWLKGADTGVMNEPMLRAFIEDGAAPENRETAAGRFVGEAHWPSPSIERRAFERQRGGARPALRRRRRSMICSPCWTGAAVGEWMGTGAPHEAPADQRLDDGFSHCFDSAPLDGAAGGSRRAGDRIRDRLGQTASRRLCARLCDVAPDGALAAHLLWRAESDASRQPRRAVGDDAGRSSIASG